MKAEDLRLGNWVKVGTVESTVEYLHRHTERPISLAGNLITNSEDQVEPIPLTEDWLRRFGFERVDHDSYHEYTIIKHEKGKSSWNYSLRWHESSKNYGWCMHTIKSVNQLQNLFHALTGEELKLKDESNNN